MSSAPSTGHFRIEPLESDARVGSGELPGDFNGMFSTLFKPVSDEALVNPLYWQGLSIGCAPTTRAVRAGEDVRAGRWEGQDNTECGLWWGDKAI